MNFTFERLSYANIHHLTPLYFALYKKRLTVSYFQKKYNTSHLTPSLFGYFAFHNGMAAGFTGMIPYELTYNGRTELAVQSLDSMTHPLYMKRGLFKILMEKVYEDLFAENISFIWGFPNDGSIKSATKKLNWLPTVPMNGYCIPVMNRYISFAKRRANHMFYGENVLSGIFEKCLVYEFPAHSLAACDYVTTVRDQSYFNYKKFGGSILIKMSGVKIWLKLNGSIFIGDMDNVSASELKQLMPFIIAKAEKCGATNIYFQTHAGSQIDNSFAAHYPHFASWKILYHNLCSAFPLEKIGVTFGDLDSF